MRSRRGNEPGEQRMPVARVGGELRMELRGDEPRMAWQLDDLDQTEFGIRAGEHHAAHQHGVQG